MTGGPGDGKGFQLPLADERNEIGNIGKRHLHLLAQDSGNHLVAALIRHMDHVDAGSQSEQLREQLRLIAHTRRTTKAPALKVLIDPMGRLQFVWRGELLVSSSAFCSIATAYPSRAIAPGS